MAYDPDEQVAVVLTRAEWGTIIHEMRLDFSNTHSRLKKTDSRHIDIAECPGPYCRLRWPLVDKIASQVWKEEPEARR